MKKLLLLLVVAITMSVTAFAQNQRVTGIVFGEDSGEPLVGATVMGVGTQIGTVTNIDGVFDILLPMDVKKISISYVGMRTQEFDITPGQMAVTLQSDNKLDEVIAVAFGTAKKSAFTGAASVMNAEELNKHVATNVADALVGSVPGLQMRGSSGKPGGDLGNITIRGISSMYADTDPLVIVDGSPYTASLSNIPQSDIESISVLKDAASAALYGARGAAGVIIITTKRGNSETAKVSVDMKWGANTRADRDYDLIDNPAEYYEAGYATLNNYFLNVGQTADRANLLANSNMLGGNFLGNYNIYDVPAGEQLIGLDGKINPNAKLGRKYTSPNGDTYYLINDDWTDLAYKTALRQEYNVSVNGGNDRSSFYASVGYLDEGGVIEYSGYKRLTARLKADYKAKSWLKLGANVSYTHAETESSPNLDQSSGAGNLMYFTNNIAPIYPVFVRTVDANGNPVIKTNEHGLMYDYGRGNRDNGYGNIGTVNLNRPFASGENPLGNNRYNDNTQHGNQFNGTFTADFIITPWLKANISSNVIWGNTRQSTYDNPFFGATQGVNGRLVKTNTETLRTNNVQTLTYTNTFGAHSVNAMIGHEYYKTTTNYLSASASGGFSPDIQEINGFAYKYTSAGYKQAYNVEGYFFSGQYDYDGKYFGSVSFRRDASSRFAKDHRWGNFWSVGGAWIVNKDFFQDVKWVNLLKLKASIGQQGNDNIGNWAYTDTYNITSSSQTDMSPSFRQVGNPDITWETTTNFNLGVEFGLFGNRLTGNIDFYNKKTTDLLFWLNIPESMGSRGYYGNLGDIRNTGVELQLNGVVFRNKLIDWSINMNLSHNKNKILKLPESQIRNLGGFSMSDDSRTVQSWLEEGGSMYELFLPEVAGLTEDGVQLYWMDSDLCSEVDGVMVSLTDRPGTKRDLTTTDPNNATNYKQGSNLPKLFGGFGTTLKVGPVDLSVAFDYQIGGKMFDTRYMNYMDPNNGPTGSNWHKDWANSWSPTNTSSDIPRWQYADQFTVYKSNRFLTDASYLNFQSFMVGYTLPSFCKEISNLRVYVQGENLCYWSKRKGFDPRYSFTSGASVAAYNPIRNISGGIQVNF